MKNLPAYLLLITCLGLSFLAACSATATRNVQATVYGMETALNAALVGATVYKTLPDCAPALKGLCKDETVMKQIIAAQAAAAASLDAAEKIVRDPNAMDSSANAAVAAAQASLAAFQAIVPAVETIKTSN